MRQNVRTLDDIAVGNRGYKINPGKAEREYIQHMQSLYGRRKFLLITEPSAMGGLKITLKENKNGMWSRGNTRHAVNRHDENEIHRAIKSLERKAGCKLYYVLLISTDGEYL